MKREGIAATRDGDIGHCSKTTTRQKKIVPVVDVAVNTIYSCLHSRPKPYLFSNPLQPTAAIFDSGTIVNTALTLISIRPASGRSLVRVWACGGFDGMPSIRLNQHQSHAYSTQAAASLRVGKVEDQVLPGGGCA